MKYNKPLVIGMLFVIAWTVCISLHIGQVIVITPLFLLKTITILITLFFCGFFAGMER